MLNKKEYKNKNRIGRYKCKEIKKENSANISVKETKKYKIK